MAEYGVRSFLCLLTWLMFMALATIGLAYFVANGRIITELMMLQVLAFLTLIFLAGPSPAARPAARTCEACAGRLFATRYPQGGRLWTCFRCGREIARRRTSAQLVESGLAR